MKNKGRVGQECGQPCVYFSQWEKSSHGKCHWCPWHWDQARMETHDQSYWRRNVQDIGEGNGSEQGSQLTQLAAFLWTDISSRFSESPCFLWDSTKYMPNTPWQSLGYIQQMCSNYGVSAKSRPEVYESMEQSPTRAVDGLKGFQREAGGLPEQRNHTSLAHGRLEDRSLWTLQPVYLGPKRALMITSCATLGKFP